MVMIDLNIGRRIPVAITIAGSDSGGGAGIQADLKTFAALQVHGTVAITSITAQNTYEVSGVEDISPEMVREQILTVYRDLGIDAGKSGMLHKTEIIEVVADTVRELGFPYVLDPVMIAKSGAKLLRDDAIESLIKRLFPIATVVTPNRFEAERIVGYEIKSIDDAVKASEDISRLGPEYVVLKGGHIEGEKSIDILYRDGKVKFLEAPRIKTRTTHGTGCSFSAAIAAFIARGLDVEEAVEKAKRFITISIKYGLELGSGSGPVNPMAYLYNEAVKHRILEDLYMLVKRFESIDGFEKLIPEVGLNIAYSTPYPMDKGDIAAFPGRIRYAGELIYEYPRFGVSSHLARYILTAKEYDPSINLAMNIRYDPEYIEILRSAGYKIGFYDRGDEPPEVKSVEGGTIPWGVKNVYERLGMIPDVIYHEGDVGKEAMIVILSRSIEDLYEVVKKLMGGGV